MSFQTAIVPKGYTRFYYNYYGACSPENQKIYFDCITQKSAIEKWDQWIRNKLITSNQLT